ncbi:MAG: hypothetical protein ONB48_02965 [candidate division KSB1 bacterium]|nr:hypothetical protein [candidate division KSB1 bacterium]MDZ7275702.1 hypothetical protein [candidate division KSB1 bacterium]MDZ7284607.1 hypothetical protein [candidate division KSB1 bacterium]MDZ7297974.1 hypothetical protein [candidate division KSB1 bacterium]MDZ7305858.1 hypothetical protein [candidate division KSB1 bacterium]
MTFIRCHVVFLMLSLVLAHGQTHPTLRLQNESRQVAGTPLIDRAGETIAWRAGNSLLWQNQHGSNLLAQPGRFLKQALSANGEVLAVLQMTAPDTLVLRWFDQHGRAPGRHTLPRHEDDPLPQICLSREGTALLLAQPATAQVLFFSSADLLPGPRLLFDSVAYLNERPLFLAAAGESFLVLSQPEVSNEQRPGQPVLICFSLAGQERWRRELPAGTAGGLEVSRNGEWIIASHYHVDNATGAVTSAMVLFDREGAQQAATAGLFRQARFSDNGERLFVMDRRQVRLLKLPGLDTVWQSSLTSRNEMFVDIAMDPAGRDHFFALAAVSTFKHDRFVFEHGRLIKFIGGHPRTSVRLSEELVNPTLAFSTSSQRLLLAADGLVQRYTVVSVVRPPGKRAIKQ